MRAREIEEESLKIIEESLAKWRYPEREVVKRVIHATADFGFADAVFFHNQAVERGIEAIRSRKPIITDVNMVKAGITKYGGKVKCFIDRDEVYTLSKNSDKTRAASAFLLFKEELKGNIVAIGNAPTALSELCSIIEEGMTPALVVAAPVGFVGAKEAKEEILNYDIPSIVVGGRRGGSSIAAAVVNALIKLSGEGR